MTALPEGMEFPVYRAWVDGMVAEWTSDIARVASLASDDAQAAGWELRRYDEPQQVEEFARSVAEAIQGGGDPYNEDVDFILACGFTLPAPEWAKGSTVAVKEMLIPQGWRVVFCFADGGVCEAGHFADADDANGRAAYYAVRYGAEHVGPPAGAPGLEVA